MLTPVFTIKQNDETLSIEIRAPYAKLAELEIECSDNIFVFSAPPYYLRLHLPHNVSEDVGDSTKFECDSGIFTVTVKKETPGQFFPGLDMVTQLLRPQTAVSAKPLIEELDSDGDKSGSEDGENGDGDQYLIEQKFPDATLRDETAEEFGYGFGWRAHGVLEKMSEQIGDVCDLREPRKCPISKRAEACEDFDREHFNENRYLTDTIEPDEELLAAISQPFNATTSITPEDIERLKNLPNKKLARLSAEDTYATALSLVDIVYAFCYDQRINGWETGCESGYMISKVAPSLAFLVRWTSVHEAAIGAVRRSLCVPLYRHWELSTQVLEDTKLVFSKGRSALVHVLCVVHSLMVSASEFRYLLNDLIITDLLLWIQAVSDDVICRLMSEVSNVKVSKEDISLGLDELVNSALEDMIAHQGSKLKSVSLSDADISDESEEEDIDEAVNVV